MKSKEARKKVRDYKGEANSAFLQCMNFFPEGTDVRHELYVFKFKVDAEARKMFRSIKSATKK